MVPERICPYAAGSNSRQLKMSENESRLSMKTSWSKLATWHNQSEKSGTSAIAYYASTLAQHDREFIIYCQNCQ
jgi:hypothetical protein